MVRVDPSKWGQTLEDLGRLALHAPHPRTHERFLALAQIADVIANATSWAHQYDRQDETVCWARPGRASASSTSNASRRSLCRCIAAR